MPKPCFISTRRQWLAVGALTLAGGPVVAQSTVLDGRRFEGVFLQRGKTSGDADTLSFKDGQFHSRACDRYGYSKANYRTSAAGDAITFEVETVSAKYGRLQWKGVVRSDKLDATATMLQDGKAPLEHWVVAASVK